MIKKKHIPRKDAIKQLEKMKIKYGEELLKEKFKEALNKEKQIFHNTERS